MVAALLRALIWFGAALGPLLMNFLVHIGVTAVVFTGVTTAMDNMRSMFMSELSELPVAVIDLLGVMNVDIAFSMLFSALTIRLVMNGINNGTKRTYKF